MSEVIELNQHRLLNGDATNREDVEKLIGDCKVDLLLTDPPYGINIVNTNGGGKLEDKVAQPLDHSIERESKWHQLEEQNHQASTGTVGTPARPGFKNLRRGGGAKSLW